MSNSGLKIFGVISGVLASLVCLAGGIWILAHFAFKKDEILSTGIGLYFIGKSLFVGPLLIITACKKIASR